MENNKVLQVAISGIFYPLAIMHYFIRAFRRRNDVELLLVGAFTGDWIPWNGGMRLPQKYIIIPDIALPQSTIQNKIPFSFVKNKVNKNIDIWIQIDAGWHFLTRPEANVVIHIQTDPHVLKQTYNLPKSYSDVNYCMQEYYMVDGEKYLPYAFDPTIHYPLYIDKEHDACLIGLHYENRTMLVNELRRMGYNVHYSIGEIYDEYREIYNKSKIALSWSSLYDVPARVFEAMGMRIPLVANRTPDMQKLFVDGKEYLGFDNLQEAIDKAVYLINYQSECEKISQNAYDKVIGKHTWDIRVQQILEDIYK